MYLLLSWIPAFAGMTTLSCSINQFSLFAGDEAVMTDYEENSFLTPQPPFIKGGKGGIISPVLFLRD